MILRYNTDMTKDNQKTTEKNKQDWVDKLVAWGCQLLHLTKYQKILTQLAKFVIAGVITTAIDWSLFAMLVYVFNVGPMVTKFFSFMASTLVSYYINTIWVFDTTKNKSRQRLVTEFFVFSGIAFAISEVLIYVFIYQWHWNDMLANIVTTAITMVFNYVTRKLFLEERKKSHKTTTVSK